MGETYNATTTKTTLELVHRRLGHASITVIRKMAQLGLIDGLSPEDVNGQHSVSMRPLSTEPLQLVHSDVVGPFGVVSHGGNRYAVLFVDDYTRYVSVYPIARKSDVLDGRKLKVLRSDNGGEYTSTAFAQLRASSGIRQQFTVPGTP